MAEYSIIFIILIVCKFNNLSFYMYTVVLTFGAKYCVALFTTQAGSFPLKIKVNLFTIKSNQINCINYQLD